MLHKVRECENEDLVRTGEGKKMNMEKVGMKIRDGLQTTRISSIDVFSNRYCVTCANRFTCTDINKNKDGLCAFHVSLIFQQPQPTGFKANPNEFKFNIVEMVKNE